MGISIKWQACSPNYLDTGDETSSTVQAALERVFGPMPLKLNQNDPYHLHGLYALSRLYPCLMPLYESLAGGSSILIEKEY